VTDALVQFAATTGPPEGTLGAVFSRHGEYWTLAYGGEVSLLRDAKGLHYLAVLLRSPDEKISVAALVAETGAPLEPISAADLERHRSAVTKRIRDALRRIERNHPALGRHLSARVKTGYECTYVSDPDQPVVWKL